MDKKMTAQEELLTNKDLEALIAVGVVSISRPQTSTHSANSDKDDTYPTRNTNNA